MKAIPASQFAPEKVEELQKAAQGLLNDAFSEPGQIQLVGVNFCFSDQHGNRIEIGVGEVKSEDPDEYEDDLMSGLSDEDEL